MIGKATLSVFLVWVIAAGCSAQRPVWSADVRELTISHGGGGLGPPFVATPECPAERVEYKLSVEHRQLDASRCWATDAAGQPLPLQHTVALHAITQPELDALVPELEALHVVEGGLCGADRPAVTLTVTTASDTTLYADSFYAGCDQPSNDHRPAVDYASLDAVEAALRQLAFSAPP